jgi:oligopeptide/dipeptide ABC transporter ATP-binding protein
MESLVEVNDLCVTYAARGQLARAVDGVSLGWRQGEVLGIVGESGCGKSTLARAIMGLSQPAGGEVLLGGEPVTGKESMRGLRRRVQMIFQDPYQTLNPRQRVRTIVAEPLVVQGLATGEHDERVNSALADVGLDPEQYRDRYPHQLSGGQRQRVAIAAALVLEPDGLICDEPVSMLDTSVRTQVLRVLMGLREKRGLALIFITHDLSLAWSLCDRIAVMYLGRVVEQGGAADVIERPRHPYTQALVDAIPVPVPGGGGRRELLSGEIPDPTAIPAGCRFHPRCPKRFGPPCETVDPALLGPLSEGAAESQLAACLLYDPDHGPVVDG